MDSSLRLQRGSWGRLAAPPGVLYAFHTVRDKRPGENLSDPVLSCF